jgi:UDP-GlcNAc3NAcA epimerase
MKILSVVGTRPNIIKEFMMHREFARRGIEEVIVHTGQHYDYEMSQVFFEGFQLPDARYHLNQRGKTNIQQTASILAAMEEILQQEKPTCTLVYGDVNSTAAAALASAKLRIPVVHIEGGVRSHQLYNPEEINRRVTDHLSVLIFACTRTDYQNLLREGFEEDRIFLSGDIVKDALLYTIEQHNIPVKRGDYICVTIHREENVESPERLRSIVEGLLQCQLPVIFPVHPRTRERLKQYGLWEALQRCKRVELREPQGYVQFVKLLSGANRVFTDSGGVRREAYILEKPVIVPIDIVWFPEILEAGWMKVVEPNPQEIAHALKHFEPPSAHPEIFGDGKAYQRIVARMCQFFEGERSSICAS